MRNNVLYKSQIHTGDIIVSPFERYMMHECWKKIPGIDLNYEYAKIQPENLVLTHTVNLLAWMNPNGKFSPGAIFIQHEPFYEDNFGEFYDYFYEPSRRSLGAFSLLRSLKNRNRDPQETEELEYWFPGVVFD